MRASSPMARAALQSSKAAAAAAEICARVALNKHSADATTTTTTMGDRNLTGAAAVEAHIRPTRE